MDWGHIEEHFHPKHCRPNIKNSRARGKRPIEDQLASKLTSMGTLMNTQFLFQEWIGDTLRSISTQNTVCQLSKMAVLEAKDQLKINWPLIGLYLIFNWSSIDLFPIGLKLLGNKEIDLIQSGPLSSVIHTRIS